MLIRKQIELGRFAMGRELCSPVLASRSALVDRIHRAWGEPCSVVTLSVRSGFDLYLSERGFAKGDDVVMTGANVPDMATIVRHHGLKVRAVDFDLSELAPSVDRIVAAIGPATRAIVFAQLFGSRLDLAPLAAVARERGVDLIEDAAQAFDVGYRGHSDADVAMFSFGPIKTATALGGAVLTIRDPSLANALNERLRTQPVASGWSFRCRLSKYLILMTMAQPPVLAWLAKRRDLDEFLNGSARSFAGRDLMTAVREQPSRPLLRLLARRLEAIPSRLLSARREIGEELQSRLAGIVDLPRRDRTPHVHWVFPILCDNPQELVDRLRAEGFDATRCATMVPIAESQPRLEKSFGRLVYLPFSPDHPNEVRDRIVEILGNHARP